MRRRTCAQAAVPVSPLSLILAGCAGTAGTSTGTAAGGGGEKAQLTVAQTLDFYGWDPANQPGYQGWSGEAIWDPLCKTDAFGKATPDAADKLEILGDLKVRQAINMVFDKEAMAKNRLRMAPAVADPTLQRERRARRPALLAVGPHDPGLASVAQA